MSKTLTFRKILAGLILLVLTVAVGLTTAVLVKGWSLPPEIRLTRPYNDSTVTLKKGQTLSLNLENPVPPWGWEVALSKEGIIERDHGEERSRASTRPVNGIPGSPSDRTFVFRGMADGQVTLTFVVQRRDREHDQPRNTLKVQVNVE